MPEAGYKISWLLIDSKESGLYFTDRRDVGFSLELRSHCYSFELINEIIGKLRLIKKKYLCFLWIYPNYICQFHKVLETVYFDIFRICFQDFYLFWGSVVRCSDMEIIHAFYFFFDCLILLIVPKVRPLYLVVIEKIVLSTQCRLVESRVSLSSTKIMNSRSWAEILLRWQWTHTE